MRTITNSELRTFQLCKRKWFLSYVLEYASNPELEPATGVMHLGSSVHFALEAYYSHDIDPLHALRWAYSDDSMRSPGEAEALDTEFELARVMVEGYMDWVSAEGIDANVEVLGAEISVEYPVRVPGTDEMVSLRGRLDQLVRRRSDGALLARDLKTVGTLSKSQLLRISSQLKFYSMLQALKARLEGRDQVAGGEYLLILRSKRTTRATPPFYDRVEVPMNRHDLNSQYMQTMSLVQEMMSARKRLEAGEAHQSVVYPHFGDWCGWSCPFRDMCPLMDDGSRWEDMLHSQFIKNDVLAYYSHDKMNSLLSSGI